VLVGGRMRMPSDDCAAGLTESERRVVQMAARGLANRAIADELVVTLRTVESHLTHAYRKLGVRRRSELAGAIKPRRSADGGDGRPC
jgi:DNA-binding NarL/FixJ family response regulator